MATRAERFKAETERRAQAQKPKAKPKKRARAKSRDGSRAALVVEHDGEGPRVPHNLAPRALKDGVYEIEGSRNGQPSRKSTRRSLGHVKAGSSLHSKAVNRSTSPQSRATRGKPTRG